MQKYLARIDLLAGELGNEMYFASEVDAEFAKRDERIDSLEEALQLIAQWADAYPLDIFPEPDWKKSNEVLRAAGLSLDRISAANMRHVVTGVGKIARYALASLSL